MTRKKKQTTKSTRDSVTLDSVFTGIADAIRAKTGGSDTIPPRNMGNAIRAIKNVTEESIPESSLPTIFQDIADAIRACGITGTMTPSQMPNLIQSIVFDTTAEYTTESGLSDWSGPISTAITGQSMDTAPYYTNQIPNVQYAKAVSIGKSVTNIGANAFRECTYLEEVELPNSISSILSQAFAGCSSLQSISIPDSVTSIKRNAFADCSSLTSVEIGSRVTNIGQENVTLQQQQNYGSFNNCPSLVWFTVDADNQYYSSSENGMLLSKNGDWLINGINGNVSVPDGVTNISNLAFHGYTGLTSITFPDGVTNIGYSAFMNCSNCTEFNFENATSIPTLQSTDAFTGTSTSKRIYVPDNLYDQWIIASNWSDSTIKPYIYKASMKNTWNITYTLNNANATAPAKTTYTPADLPYTPPNLATTTKKPLYTESGLNWTKRVARVMTFSSWTPTSIPVGTTGDFGFSAAWNTKYTFSQPDNGATTSSQMYLFNRIPVGNYTLTVNGLTLEHTKNSGGAQDVIVVVVVSTSSKSYIVPISASHFTGYTPTDKQKTINGAGYWCGCYYFTKGQATVQQQFQLKNVPIEVVSGYANAKIGLKVIESPTTSETHSTILHQGSSTTATLTKV